MLIPLNRDFQPLSVTKQCSVYREMSLSLWKLIQLRKISWTSLSVSSFSGDEGLEDTGRPERRTSLANSFGEGLVRQENSGDAMKRSFCLFFLSTQ